MKYDLPIENWETFADPLDISQHHGFEIKEFKKLFKNRNKKLEELSDFLENLPGDAVMPEVIITYKNPLNQVDTIQKRLSRPEEQSKMAIMLYDKYDKYDKIGINIHRFLDYQIIEIADDQ